MGARKKVKSHKEREAEEKQRRLKQRYKNRFNFARLGNDAFKNHQFGEGVKQYMKYMETMAEVNNVDVFEITPEMVEPSDPTLKERLLISHIYLDLARAYDMSNKLKDLCERSLKQFVLFSINQPYQVYNSELIRKHIKKRRFNNYTTFKNTQMEILTKSRKCFIATYYFGDDHFVTRDLRAFKTLLQKNQVGLNLIDLYYYLSPKLISFLESHKNAKSLTFRFLRPSLIFLANSFRHFNNM